MKVLLILSSFVVILGCATDNPYPKREDVCSNPGSRKTAYCDSKAQPTRLNPQLPPDHPGASRQPMRGSP